MSARAEGSNAPLHSREAKALERLKRLAAQYEAEGMSAAEAEERARQEMRDNGRGDWRAG